MSLRVAALALVAVCSGCTALTRTDVSKLRSPDAGSTAPDADGARPEGGAPCIPEVCDNGVDDDCDGDADEADADCHEGKGDDCSGPARLTPGETFRGDTSALSHRVRPRCTRAEDEAPDAVHSLRVGETSDIELHTFGSELDTVLSLRPDCSDAATELACANQSTPQETSRIFYRSLAPGFYSVLVDGDGAAHAGPYRLYASIDPARGQLGCDNALDVSGGGAVFGRTHPGMQDRHAGSCGGEGSPEEVFSLEVSAPTRLTAHTIGSEFDTVIYVRAMQCTGAPPVDAEVACDDDGSGTTSRLRAELLPGRYFLVVDGDGGSSGRYRLVAFFEPI